MLAPSKGKLPISILLMRAKKPGTDEPFGGGAAPDDMSGGPSTPDVAAPDADAVPGDIGTTQGAQQNVQDADARLKDVSAQIWPLVSRPQ